MPSHQRLAYEDFTRTWSAQAAALRTIGESASAAGIDKAIVELVKLRASQINGCAFCLQFHLNLARKLGVPAAKLDLVAAWHDAGIFSPREEAALAWAETITRIADGGVPEGAYAAVRAEFDEAEVAALTLAIGAVNLWNRLGVAFRFAPPVPREAAA